MPLISDILLINGRETIVALLVLVAYPCMTYLFEMDFLLQLRHAVTNLKHCLKLI
jgi:hypothetical protein